MELRIEVIPSGAPCSIRMELVALEPELIHAFERLATIPLEEHLPRKLQAMLHPMEIDPLRFGPFLDVVVEELDGASPGIFVDKVIGRSSRNTHHDNGRHGHLEQDALGNGQRATLAKS